MVVEVAGYNGYWWYGYPFCLTTIVGVKKKRADVEVHVARYYLKNMDLAKSAVSEVWLKKCCSLFENITCNRLCTC